MKSERYCSEKIGGEHWTLRLGVSQIVVVTKVKFLAHV